MIEYINTNSCIGCNRCVTICPTNVFDKVENSIPVIARQDKCQSCFMCELYCPVDALYVAPQAEKVLNLTQENEEELLIGSYRRNIGWAR